MTDSFVHSLLKDNIEESERKNEKKNMEESKAAQLATSEAARASMAGEDVAAVKEKEKAAAAADASSAKGSAAVSARLMGSAGMNNYKTGGSSETVLATTEAARKAMVKLGLGDDGTVKKSKSKQSVMIEREAHVMLDLSHFTSLLHLFGSHTDIVALKHVGRIFGHCNNPALFVSHFQASI